MKTVTYQQIQDSAAEMAGRPKDKLPLSEQNILLMLAADELKVMWTCCWWPELTDNLSQGPVTLVNTNGVLTFSKNEGTATEIGDIRAILTHDPRQNTGCHGHKINFETGNGQITVFPPCGWGSQVWVDYQLPPTDLLAVNLAPGVALPVIGYAAGGNTLSNLLLPARFYQPLAFMMAAKLLLVDGLTTQAAGLKGLAQENLDWQSARPEMKDPPWMNVSIRR